MGRVEVVQHGGAVIALSRPSDGARLSAGEVELARALARPLAVWSRVSVRFCAVVVGGAELDPFLGAAGLLDFDVGFPAFGVGFDDCFGVRLAACYLRRVAQRLGGRVLFEPFLGGIAARGHAESAMFMRGSRDSVIADDASASRSGSGPPRR